MNDLVLNVLIKVFIMVTMLPLHECAHGWMAKKMGDRSAQMLGRLTLNPTKHLDLFGSICMILFGFGWAKPVPVNPDNFKWKNKKLAMALVAFAGPLSNIVAALVGAFIWGAFTFFNLSAEAWEAISFIFANFVQINIVLAVFNLIPIPPLDGSKILYTFLPDKWVYKIEQFSQYYFFIILIIIYIADFSSIISLVGGGILKLIMFLVNGFYGLFI